MSLAAAREGGIFKKKTPSDYFNMERKSCYRSIASPFHFEQPTAASPSCSRDEITARCLLCSKRVFFSPLCVYSVIAKDRFDFLRYSSSG